MTPKLIPHSPHARTFVIRSIAPSLILLTACWVLASRGMSAQQPPSPQEQAEKLRQAGLSDATAGRIDDAIAAFQKALALEPGNAALLDAAGAAYSLKGELETARKYFVESLAANPDSVSTRQNLGIVLFSLGKIDEASQQFTRIREVPGKPRAVASLFLGMIAQHHSDCSKAISLIADSGQLLYQYPEALLSYSQCEYQLGDLAHAKEGLAALGKLPGKTAQQAEQAAALSARLARTQNAPHDAGAGEMRNSAGADTVLKQAAALEKANRMEEAQKLLESEAARQPTFDVLFALAEIAKQRSDFAVTMKSLKRAAEVEPGREESYLEFSTICADHGNDQLALDAAEIGLEHVPDSYRLTVQKGAVQEKLGHLQDAEQTLKKALVMQKDNSIALASLAVVQAHSGRANEAEETLAHAIAQFPDNDYMYYFRAKLLLQLGPGTIAGIDRREVARQSLEKAIQLNPGYADSYYQLSSLYDTSPKLTEKALEKCLRLDPNHIAAQYALARLYVRTGRKAQGEALFARLKGQQRTEEMQKQKQLWIEVAQK